MEVACLRVLLLVIWSHYNYFQDFKVRKLFEDTLTGQSSSSSQLLITASSTYLCCDLSKVVRGTSILEELILLNIKTHYHFTCLFFPPDLHSSIYISVSHPPLQLSIFITLLSVSFQTYLSYPQFPFSIVTRLHHLYPQFSITSWSNPTVPCSTIDHVLPFPPLQSLLVTIFKVRSLRKRNVT